MDLISVIVPMYNVEKYLKQCLDSILQQTYSNLEIILIDDGSTDGCYKIAEEYAKKDKRIKVLHQKNQGISIARNNGIEIASGKYIAFVDSDDYLEKDMYETLYNICKKYNADMAVVGINKVHDKEGRIEKLESDNYEKIMSKQDAYKIMINDDLGFRVETWNKLYKKELFNDIRYPQNKLYEDVGTTYLLVDKAKKIVYNSSAKYNYRIREKSITKNKSFTLKEMDRVEFAKKMTDFVKEKYPNVKNEMEIYMLINYIATLNKMILDKKNEKDFIDEVVKTFRKDIFIIIKSKLKIKKKIQFIALAVSPRVYGKILLKYK